MTSRRRARWLVLVAGLAAVASLLGAAWWQRADLLRLWRLRELRERPELLGSWLLVEDPARQGAIERFLTEPAGKEELFELYLREFERVAWDYKPLDPLRRARKTGLRGGVLCLRERGFALRMWYGHSGHNHSSMGVPPADEARRSAILARLDALPGRTYRSELLPGYEFEVQQVREGEPQRPAWPGTSVRGREEEGRGVRWRERSGDPEHICFFRRLR